jgi:surface antigen
MDRKTRPIPENSLMIRKTLYALILGSSVAIGGCATYQGPSEQAGMVIGGVLGGVLGSEVGAGSGRTAAIIAGSLIGAAIGGAVGQSMDEVDRMKTAETLETVRTGVPAQWVNPDTGHRYTVVPTRTYETTAGPCREYTIDAVVGGRVEQVYGTACRQPDGSWRVQN